ncbi:MAG: hypothetical protein ACI9OT_001863, partial [Gammaproteobacteria bacterium]
FFHVFKNFAKEWLSESFQMSLKAMLLDYYFCYFGK